VLVVLVVLNGAAHPHQYTGRGIPLSAIGGESATKRADRVARQPARALGPGRGAAGQVEHGAELAEVLAHAHHGQDLFTTVGPLPVDLDLPLFHHVYEVAPVTLVESPRSPWLKSTSPVDSVTSSGSRSAKWVTSSTTRSAMLLMRSSCVATMTSRSPGCGQLAQQAQHTFDLDVIEMGGGLRLRIVGGPVQSVVPQHRPTGCREPGMEAGR
jgi:hypothetical protein